MTTYYQATKRSPGSWRNTGRRTGFYYNAEPPKIHATEHAHGREIEHDDGTVTYELPRSLCGREVSGWNTPFDPETIDPYKICQRCESIHERKVAK